MLPRVLNILLPLVVLVPAAVLVYAGGRGGPFIFDDNNAIVENDCIETLWPLTDAMRAPDQSTVSGRPIVCLSLAINYAIGERDVAGYHDVNVGLHALCALLLYGVLRRTVVRCGVPGFADAPRAGVARWFALAVTLVWVVHPLQTEAVQWVVQRTELLVSLFYLATLYGAVRGFEAWEASEKGKRGRASAWFAFAVIACGLGMGSKEVMVSAPVMVLLYDRVFVGTTFRKALTARPGLYLGLAATLIVLGAILLQTPRAGSAGFGHDVSWLDYLRTQAGVIVHYLRLSLWPDPLVLAYDWPVVRSWGPSVLPGLIVVGLLVATVNGLASGRALALAGALFFLVLAPTSSVVPIVTEVIAERRMYLPLASVVVAIAVGVAAGLGRIPSLRARAIVGLGLAACGAGALAYGSVVRVRDYETEERIWRVNHQVYPDGYQSNAGFGNALLASALRGERAFADAIPYLEKAVARDADDEFSWRNLALACARSGRYHEAVGHYGEALRRRPDEAASHHNLGIVLFQLDRLDEAETHLRRADELRPDYAPTRGMLERVRARRREQGA